MNVTGVYRQDAMKRQIAEAVRIGDAGLAMLMNKKNGVAAEPRATAD